MQKTIIFGLVGLLLVFGLLGQKEIDTPGGEFKSEEYLSFTGSVEEIRGSSLLIREINNEDNSIVFNISEKVVLFDDETQNFITMDNFKLGMKVTAYYPENTPMALSLPPILTPSIIVVNSSETFMSTHVGHFNDELISNDGMLKIYINEKTNIVDIKGNPVSKNDITNKNLVVFYTISTKSIPAQTTPHKIIVL